MVILRTHQERNRSLVESSSLPIPLLDTIEGAFPCQVEHEQDSHSIIANQRQHVYEFSLSSQIPDRERNLRIAYADGLLHEVHAKCLDIIFVPAALDVFYHEGGLANLCIAHHANLNDDAILVALIAASRRTPGVLILVCALHVAVPSIA